MTVMLQFVCLEELYCSKKTLFLFDGHASVQVQQNLRLLNEQASMKITMMFLPLVNYLIEFRNVSVMCCSSIVVPVHVN